MQFGQIHSGDGDNSDDTTDDLLQQLEETNAILRSVRDALQRLDEMPAVDTRPSPSVPTPHPLDNEKEVNKDE